MKKTVFNLVLAAAAAFLFSAPALAAPAQIIIIRHAEKPETGSELNAKGAKRAEALVWFFKAEPAVTRYGTPAAIYAAAPKNEDSSVRSIQTVTPLARALRLPINTDFTRGQTHKIVVDIMENPAYKGRMVLICWQHTNITEIVKELADYKGSWNDAQYFLPGKWPDEAFDRAWVLNFTKGKVVSFQDVPQRLLPGDSF
jgi:broad specificity phosphatase PhoE